MKHFPKSKTFLKAACFFFLLFSHQTTSNACKCINASNFDTFLHHRAASLLISLDLSTLEISIKYQMCTPKYAFAQKMQDLKNSSILWICCAFHRVFPCQKSKSTLYQLVMGQTPIYRTSNKLNCGYNTDDRTRTPEFLLETNEHLTSNLKRPSLNLQNHSSNRLEHIFLNIKRT